jgi:transcriptional regulator with XRE-family HTH domain
MSPQELRNKRLFMNLTQKQLADKFCITERTIRNYESGATEIPRTVEMALSALELEQK